MHKRLGPSSREDRVEEVECAECGHRYDSDEHPFCPRCGKVGAGAPATVDFRADRHDPGRRRARTGGVILTVVGALALIQFAYVAISPPALDEQQLAAYQEFELIREQPGGALHVRVLSNGEPVAANVTIQPATGEPVSLTASSTGWANATSLPAAFGNVTVTAAGNSTVIQYYVPTGAVLEAEVELDDPPAWLAVDQLEAVRVIAAFLAFFAAFVVLGGIMAIRLKWWGLGLAAAIVAVLPGLLLLAFVPLGGILLALPAAIALLFIVGGRRHFA